MDLVLSYGFSWFMIDKVPLAQLLLSQYDVSEELIAFSVALVDNDAVKGLTNAIHHRLLLFLDESYHPLVSEERFILEFEQLSHLILVEDLDVGHCRK